MPAGIGALVVWLICSSRRDHEIGGWLLCFYIQLYVGVVLIMVLTAFSFQNYLPHMWAAAPGLYPLFLLSTVPTDLVLLVQLVVAEKMRRSRDYKYVRALRYLLWANLATAVLTTAIDLQYFELEDTFPFDVLDFVWPAVWLPYFYASKRMVRVFRTKDWLPSAQSPPAG